MAWPDSAVDDSDTASFSTGEPGRTDSCVIPWYARPATYLSKLINSGSDAGSSADSVTMPPGPPSPLPSGIAVPTGGSIPSGIPRFPPPGPPVPRSPIRVELPFSRTPTSVTRVPSIVMSAVIHVFSPSSRYVAIMSS